MRPCPSSRVKRKTFYRKSELQMFLLISGGYIGWPKQYTYMASSMQSSTKVRDKFREITQKLWATKTWDVDKLYIYYSFITFHFLGFFHWTVSNLFLCCVTVKTIYILNMAVNLLIDRWKEGDGWAEAKRPLNRYWTFYILTFWMFPARSQHQGREKRCFQAQGELWSEDRVACF